jgi:hypothetical protein
MVLAGWWSKSKCLVARANQAFVGACQRLLRLADFFSPPWLLRLLVLLLPRALARSLCALPFCVLALPPLLAAWARLEPLPDDDFD